MRALQYVNRYLKKYRYLLLLGFFFTVSSRVFAVLAPSLVGDSITEIEQFIQSGSSDLSAIKKILVTNITLIIGAAFISVAFTFSMRQTIINVSRHIEYDLKNTIYDHYQKLSLRFYKQNEIIGRTPNWDSERIADLDFTLLLMALAELLYFPSIPVNVTINEYLEIAKEYATPKSSMFINGVLDKSLKELSAQNRIRKNLRGMQ